MGGWDNGCVERGVVGGCDIGCGEHGTLITRARDEVLFLDPEERFGSGSGP